jgi:hypothetical protein
MGRVIAIFALVAAVCGGGLFWFFKIHRPAQVKKGAQDEIASWEERWNDTRACLLGKTPRSSKTSEALAIHEMLPDPWDRQKCTPLVAKLTRGDAPDTGLAPVEDAWVELDHAAAKAAEAFAMHVVASTTLATDPLPAALDNLDAARAKLRSAAELPATEQAGKPLVVAQVIPLLDGTKQITQLDITNPPSAHGLVATGATEENREVRVVFTAGGTPQIARLGAGAMRALPDGSWGAAFGDAETRIGAFDADGAMPSPATVKIAEGLVAQPIGTLADGMVPIVGRNKGDANNPGNDQIIWAHVKAGAVTTDPPLDVKLASIVADVDGRAALIWDPLPPKQQRASPPPGDPPGKVRMLPDGAALDLPAWSSGVGCFTSDRLWVPYGDLAGSGLVSVANGQAITEPLMADFLMGCTPEVALMRSQDSRAPLAICGPHCRPTQIPHGAPTTAALTVVDGKLVAIVAHSGVLGVWREGADPIFYALPEPAQPVLAHEWTAMAMTDGKVIDVLARGAKTFVVARIPAH